MKQCKTYNCNEDIEHLAKQRMYCDKCQKIRTAKFNKESAVKRRKSTKPPVTKAARYKMWYPMYLDENQKR